MKNISKQKNCSDTEEKDLLERRIILIFATVFICLLLSGCTGIQSVSNASIKSIEVTTNTVVNTNKTTVTNSIVNTAKAANTSKVNTSAASVNTAVKKVEPVATQSASACLCDGADLDCPDFSTHEKAQTCYTKCLTSTGRDIFGLDGDDDGSACESNASSNPSTVTNTAPAYTAPTTTCCKVCSKGKACGDSCISRSYTCHKSPGCACDG